MAPHLDPPWPARTPPAGVPRWLWPPPGAEVRALTIVESAPQGRPDGHFEVLAGAPLEALHLRALEWLLHDHPCAERPPGVAYQGRVLLEVARTALADGRVGHAYALDRGPLGAPASAEARGILARYLRFALGLG